MVRKFADLKFMASGQFEFAADHAWSSHACHENVRWSSRPAQWADGEGCMNRGAAEDRNAPVEQERCGPDRAERPRCSRRPAFVPRAIARRVRSLRLPSFAKTAVRPPHAGEPPCDCYPAVFAGAHDDVLEVSLGRAEKD